MNPDPTQPAQEQAKYRQLLAGEEFQQGDEYWNPSAKKWEQSINWRKPGTVLMQEDFQYRRRVTPTHAPEYRAGAKVEADEADSLRAQLAAMREIIQSMLHADWCEFRRGMNEKEEIVEITPCNCGKQKAWDASTSGQALLDRLLRQDQELAKWKQWAEYACKRFTEETGKDLQAQGA